MNNNISSTELFIVDTVEDKSFYFNNSLFNAQFYPEGLKAYTRNIYKQRTQVK
jgi:hypothetical protein